MSPTRSHPEVINDQAIRTVIMTFNRQNGEVSASRNHEMQEMAITTTVVDGAYYIWSQAGPSDTEADQTDDDTFRILMRT